MGKSELIDLLKIQSSPYGNIRYKRNSTYGFLGRGQGNLILKELGSIVTAVGRQLIEQSKEYAECEFLNYIKSNNLLTQRIQYRELDLTKEEKKKILETFKINQFKDILIINYI